MKRFVQLFTDLDDSNRTNDKVAAMRDYFTTVEAGEAAWALFFLCGKRLPAPLKSKTLRVWAAQLSGLPDWLVKETYDHVGDLAETVALLLPDPKEGMLDTPLDAFVDEHVIALRDWDEPIQFQMVRKVWAELDSRSRFVYNKLITGAFRVGVSRRLVVRALSQVVNIDPAVMEHRLLGNWSPSPEAYRRLLEVDSDYRDPAQPYPFYLASPLEDTASSLGSIKDWRAEWKWDGIRAQLIRRKGIVVIWSRGEEIMNERFPEITEAATRLPEGTVLDGEILCWKNNEPLPFSSLQTRIGRKNVTKQTLDNAPAVFLSYDCLEFESKDLREQTLRRRMEKMQEATQSIKSEALLVGKAIEGASWNELEEARSLSRKKRVEGLMLKHYDSPYRVGRVRGDWWKWKIDPYSVDAVMIYAQAGHGRRAGLFTDYTFAVWDGDDLVPFAKAYSGLTDKEISRLDNWIKKHTLDRKGPVRIVEPELVFELHFEGIAESTRHRSGIAVRFPRIARWREDKTAKDADTLENVKKLLNAPT